jgi:hypothetical protein
MNCYVLFIYDSVYNNERVDKMSIISGSKDDAGKYIKKNITEFYDYFITIANNVRNTSDDDMNDLELLVKDAFKKYKYQTNSKKYRELIMSEVKVKIDELSDTDIITNMNSFDRELLINPNKDVAYKIIETRRFMKSLGTASVIYNIPHTFQ